MASVQTYVVTFAYSASAAAQAAVRPERYAWFQRLTADGSLLASGQLLDASLGDGLLILRAADEASARTVLAEDPYARAGFVKRVDLAAWNPTIGTWLAD